MICLPGISVSSITPELSEEVIQLLGQSKFRTFESVYRTLPRDRPELIRKFREMLARSGKKAPTYHCPYGAEYDISSPDENIRRNAVAVLGGLLPEAAACGASMVVVHSSPGRIAPDERPVRINQVRRSLAGFEPLLGKQQMRMAVELLPRTCIGNTAVELLAILRNTPECFGACLDVNHLMSDIGGLPETVRALAHRLYHLHISDYDGIDEKHWLPGRGQIDWKASLSALSQAGYRGAFNYELRLEGAPKERLRMVEDNYVHKILPLMQSIMPASE